MRYYFKIHEEQDGYWAQCLEIPGCVTQADSKDELFENMQDALNTYLEEPPSSDYLAPLPKRTVKLSSRVVEVMVDPSIAFAYSIRRQRIRQGLTQKETAKMLGMKNIYSYQRLEKRCNPTLELIVSLVALFPKLSIDKILK